MRFAGDIKKQLESAHNELRVLNKFMLQNGFGKMNIYRNPYTSELTPGVTYGEIIAFYIGRIEALEYSLNKKL